MAQFIETSRPDVEMPAYINREKLLAIFILPTTRPEIMGEYPYTIEYVFGDEELDLYTYHKTLESATAEAKRVAFGEIMTQFFKIRSSELNNLSVKYINRDLVTDIRVIAEPDSDGEFEVQYTTCGNGDEVTTSWHPTLEEAKAEARRIAEGIGEIIPQ